MLTNMLTLPTSIPALLDPRSSNSWSRELRDGAVHHRRLSSTSFWSNMLARVRW